MARSNFDKYFSDPETASMTLSCIDQKYGVTRIMRADSKNKQIAADITGKEKASTNMYHVMNMAYWLEWLEDDATEE